MDHLIETSITVAGLLLVAIGFALQVGQVYSTDNNIAYAKAQEISGALMSGAVVLFVFIVLLTSNVPTAGTLLFIIGLLGGQIVEIYATIFNATLPGAVFTYTVIGLNTFLRIWVIADQRCGMPATTSIVNSVTSAITGGRSRRM